MPYEVLIHGVINVDLLRKLTKLLPIPIILLWVIEPFALQVIS